MERSRMNMGSRLSSMAVAIPVAALVALMLILFSESSYRQSRSAVDELNTVTLARVRMQRLLLLVTDAETSERGTQSHQDPAEAVVRPLGDEQEQAQLFPLLVKSFTDSPFFLFSGTVDLAVALVSALELRSSIG